MKKLISLLPAIPFTLFLLLLFTSCASLNNLSDKIFKCKKIIILDTVTCYGDSGTRPGNHTAFTDSDQDGVPDSVDQCPYEAGEKKYHGCPASHNTGAMIADRDRDGISDNLDKCPDIPGTRANNGCPEDYTESGHSEDLHGERAYTDHSIKPIEISVHETVKPRSAILGFCYHKEMRKTETKDFYVYVSATKHSREVQGVLHETERKQMELVGITDSCQTYTVDISVYDYLTVSLLYDKSDFEITPVSTDEKQFIDSVSGNNWHWRIKAITDKPIAVITLNINAEIPPGIKKNIENKNIPIRIKVDSTTIFRRFFNYLLETPAVTIPSILIPVIGFVVKLRRDKKKKAAAPRP